MLVIIGVLKGQDSTLQPPTSTLCILTAFVTFRGLALYREKIV